MTRRILISSKDEFDYAAKKTDALDRTLARLGSIFRINASERDKVVIYSGNTRTDKNRVNKKPENLVKSALKTKPRRGELKIK